MFWPTEAKVSCNNLSVLVTYEHMSSVLSSTHLQLIGGGGRLGEPSRSKPDTPGDKDIPTSDTITHSIELHL
jgi:hypothetical protein